MLSVIWKGMATKENIKEVKSAVMEMIGQTHCRFILNDMERFFCQLF